MSQFVQFRRNSTNGILKVTVQISSAGRRKLGDTPERLPLKKANCEFQRLNAAIVYRCFLSDSLKQAKQHQKRRGLISGSARFGQAGILPVAPAIAVSAV